MMESTVKLLVWAFFVAVIVSAYLFPPHERGPGWVATARWFRRGGSAAVHLELEILRPAEAVWIDLASARLEDSRGRLWRSPRVSLVAPPPPGGFRDGVGTVSGRGSKLGALLEFEGVRPSGASELVLPVIYDQILDVVRAVRLRIGGCT